MRTSSRTSDAAIATKAEWFAKRLLGRPISPLLSVAALLGCLEGALSSAPGVRPEAARPGGGDAGIDSDPSEIDRSPVAALTISTEGEAAPLLARLNASGSFDPGGGDLRASWLIGGERLEERGLAVERIFEKPGEYVIEVEVENESGLSARARRVLIVERRVATVILPIEVYGEGGGERERAVRDRGRRGRRSSLPDRAPARLQGRVGQSGARCEGERAA